MKIWQRVEATVARTGASDVESVGEVRCLIWLLGLDRANELLDALDPPTLEAFRALASEAAGEIALRYPSGSDYAWYASDADGHVGMFVQFSRGPIPLVVLERWDQAEPVEE